MKKHIKLCYHLFAALAILSGVTSCTRDNFLDEELTTKRSTDFYKTEEGIKQLAIGAYYRVLSSPFASEQHYGTTNYGTDEFHVGGDDTNSQWNNYDTRFNSVIVTTRTNANEAWDNFYVGIGLTNQLIKSATEIISTNPEIKNTALGEGYFLRAYNYLKLVRQYGGVPLKTNVSTTVELEFTRATAEEVLAQVISDFTQAYNLLSNTGSPARITKDAAAHYLAKAYLTRASEINDSWNSATKAADLQQVVTLSNEVIAHHPLATNYQELWNYIRPDGPNESLSELILSAQFSRSTSLATDNTSHLYFTARYELTAFPFMQRDITGMRPYSRMAPTYFVYDCFNKVNDSRFWKSFRTKHRVNKTATYNSVAYTAGVDLGIMYINNATTDTRFTNTINTNSVIYSTTNKTIPLVYVAHASDGIGLEANPFFPSLSKHFESDRTAINDNRGMRDEILARSAETYLMAAEAKIKLAKLGTGSYTDALSYINTVRNRSAYKTGENRRYYVDGAESYPTSDYKQALSVNSYMNENSYYESNNIPETTSATDLTISSINSLPSEDQSVITKLGYTTDYDRMMCLLLNERTRELCGEFHRWEDLSRTKTLVARVRAYNKEAKNNIQDYHNLRPIPQTFLDGIYKNGRPLTAEEKKEMQNIGYNN